MIPLKDNLPTDRLPIVTLLLIAANLLGLLLLDVGLFQLLVDVAFLWWFGRSIEASTASWLFVLLCLLGGATAVALGALIEPGTAVAQLAAAGVVAAILGGYLLLYPGARVVTAVFLPGLFTLLELPALVLLALWVALQALVGATGEVGMVAFLAPLGAFAVGLLAIKPLARRPLQVPPRRAEVALP